MLFCFYYFIFIQKREKKSGQTYFIKLYQTHQKKQKKKKKKEEKENLKENQFEK